MPRIKDITQAQAQNLVVLYKQGLLQEALVHAVKLAKTHPQSVFLLNLIGVINAALGRFEAAIASYRRALVIRPEHAEIHNNLGNALNKLGKPEEAIASFKQALLYKSDYAEAHNNLGNALNKLGKPEEAIASFKRALFISPYFSEAFSNLGNTFKQIGRLEEAVASFKQALSINPGDAEDYNNLGFALQELGRQEEAVASFKRALSINPGDAEGHNNLGYALQELGRQEEAVASFKEALSINPDLAGAYNNLGNVLQRLGRPEEAVASFKKALSISPDFAGAHNNLGFALQELGMPEEAIASYLSAIKSDPEYTAVEAQILRQLSHMCDWQRLGTSLSDAATSLKIAANTKQAPQPFSLIALSDDPLFQRRMAECWTASRYKEQLVLGPIPRNPPSDVIRIGYFSADFHNHATMYLMIRLLELHDRSKFRIHAYSFGPDTNDEMRARAVKGVDVFHDVRLMGDKEIAELSRREGIDIAIDLKGLTGYSRTGIFACRAAPIQVNYLGYPGTMGAPYMDYILADPVVIPETARENFSEKIVLLPHSYQVNDNTRAISAATATRAEHGLPKCGLVFCCFNKAYKIDPEVFDIWMRLLRNVEGSVLWLFWDNAWAETNLRQEAQKREVDPSRIIFAKPMPLPDHLARHRLADLFLDTFNYNAHTTGSDALWAGLPLVTRMGASFASRVSGSLLTALNMPELITTTSEDYEALALELATDPEKLQKIRTKLQENIKTAPLFNTELFAKHIEAAYTLMYQRYQDGLEPDHIKILDHSH